MGGLRIIKCVGEVAMRHRKPAGNVVVGPDVIGVQTMNKDIGRGFDR